MKFRVPLLFNLLLCTSIWATSANYCVEMPIFPSAGRMYAEVTWDPSHTDPNATLEFKTGKLDGKSFSGSYNSVSGRYEIGMEGDTFLGNAYVDLEIGSGAITAYSTGGSSVVLQSTGSNCDIEFQGDYCAYIGNKHYSFIFDVKSSGTVAGELNEHPVGTTHSFTGTIGASGLELNFSAGSPTAGYFLDFLNVDDSASNEVNLGFRGSKTSGGSTVPIVGVRNPVAGTVGCEGIRVFGRHSTNIFSTPTIVGTKMYVGSGGGHNKISEYNYVAKIDLPSMKADWVYEWETSEKGEVMGSVVMDGAGKLYYIAELGRDRTYPSTGDAGFPEVDRSDSIVKLVKISNPGSGGTPSEEWSTTLLDAGGDLYAIPSVTGQPTPAIGPGGLVYAGGTHLRAFSPSGTELWRFPSATGANLQIFTSPIVYDHSGKFRVIFHANDGIHAVNASGTKWEVVGSIAEYASSPQFSSIGDQVFSALNNKLFCFEPVSGGACSGWSASGCDLGLTATFRAGPVVDASGNFYIGTKDNSDSVFYKVNGSTCSSSGATWSYPSSPGTLADLYPTAALTEDGVAIASEWVNHGNIKLLDYSDGSVAESYLLNGDAGYGSLRVHAVDEDESYLIGVLNEGSDFHPGLVVAIRREGTTYLSGALNPTQRGNNAGNGLVP